MYVAMHLSQLCEDVVFRSWKEGPMSFMQTILLRVHVCVCKAYYANDKSVHAPTFTYNKVMRL